MNPLKHVAIIMDGNGRWGLKYKNSRNAGHKAGLNTVEKIIKETIKNEKVTEKIEGDADTIVAKIMDILKNKLKVI